MEEILEVRDVHHLEWAVEELQWRKAHGEAIQAFGCAVLHSGERGLDGLIAEYLAEAIDELDEATSDACLVFVLDVREGARSATALQVFRMAEFLDVRVDAFPCLAFFADPERYDTTLVVRLASYLPRRGDGYDRDDLPVAFRGVAGAVKACASKPEDERLDALREELIRIKNRDFPPDANAKPDDASPFEWVTVGTSVFQALTGALALWRS